MMKTECPKPPRYTFGKVWRNESGGGPGLAFGPIDREKGEIAPFTDEDDLREAEQWVVDLNNEAVNRGWLFWQPLPEWPEKK